MKCDERMKMKNRLAEVVYALVESGALDELNDGEGVGYDEACDLLNLTADEKSAVLALIDEDLRLF
jgi:hypothetical protein